MSMANASFLVYHDIRFRRDDLFAVYSVRLENLQSGRGIAATALTSGYRFLRLLDVQGKQIPGAVLLIRVTKALCD